MWPLRADICTSTNSSTGCLRESGKAAGHLEPKQDAASITHAIVSLLERPCSKPCVVHGCSDVIFSTALWKLRVVRKKTRRPSTNVWQWGGTLDSWPVCLFVFLSVDFCGLFHPSLVPSCWVLPRRYWWRKAKKMTRPSIRLFLGGLEKRCGRDLRAFCQNSDYVKSAWCCLNGSFAL